MTDRRAPTGGGPAAGGVAGGVEGLPDASAVLVAVLRWLREHSGELADAMAQDVRRDVPTFADPSHPELWDAVRRATADNLEAGLTAFEEGRPIDVPPAAEREFVRAAARARVPLTTLLAAHRVAQRRSWAAIVEAMHAVDAPLETREVLLITATTFLLDFVHVLSDHAATEFAIERDRAVRRSARQRLELVESLLAGMRSDLAPLDYPVRGPHLGLVVSATEAEPALRDIAVASDARLLVVSREPGLLWAWMTAPDTTLAEVGARLAYDDGLDGHWACGRPRTGAAGFRATHLQALRAYGLAVAGGPSRLRYEDVVLEVLAGRDETAAREFIADELGPLVADQPKAERLRTTLLAYLAAGQNGASAASALGISPRTMSHRLRAIEHELGRTVLGRATELHIALRLHRRPRGAPFPERVGGSQPAKPSSSPHPVADHTAV